MTTCTEPDCGGSIAADGYCDTCGVKGSAGGTTPTGSSSSASAPAATPASSPPGTPTPSSTPSSTPPPTPVAAGSACGRNGCDGTIAPDGYCDTCGLAAAPAPVPSTPAADLGAAPAAGGTAPTSTPTFAAPRPPTTSTRLGTSGGDGPSRRTRRSQRTASARTGIGRGLVTVTPTPVGDPAAAVMSRDEIVEVLGEVPEEERFCSSCGRAVGRGADGRPGRVKGFCGSCRTPFDFVTNEPSLAAGELVGGQYEILGPLAHGGMGWIYLGRDKAVSDRWVVLKGLLNESDPDAVVAAVAERQFLAQIEHANIVNIYNFVTHRGAGYIVMEMVGGESLNAKLKKRRRANGGVPDPLPPPEAMAYVLGVLPAFGYLHDAGLVYNDLKPANIMAVGDDVKLIDVGAVMRVDDHYAAIFGTQGFQAPEMATDGPSVASDLYTVGRTLAVLMLNFVYHDGPYVHALPGPGDEPLFARWESLHRFLLRACARHADDRFQSAGEMAQQLTGVLREMVAVSSGRPRAGASTLFDGDQLVHLLTASADAYDVDRPDWRVLPSSRVDPDHAAAPFLAALPEHDPERALALLDRGLAEGQVEAGNETSIHRARQLVRLGADPEQDLAAVEADDPWDWRVRWYRALHLLRHGDAVAAADRFSDVWTELPGESAPKLAVALAAEQAGEHVRAAQVYELVISADASYVSAAFGLARCRRVLGQGDGVVEALDRVPASSAAHYDAQVATVRALVGPEGGQVSLDDLKAASAAIERLQLDTAERAALSADVYSRTLDGLAAGAIDRGAGSVLGVEVDERALREGIEGTYRALARLTDDPARRIELIDRANRVRPRSLF